MIIALDSEDALRALGAADVVVAASVAQARAFLVQAPVSFAVLDFNLGGESSLAVADVLLEAGTPFIFATGYGDSIDLPERFAGAAVVKKPYSAADLAETIAKVV